MKIKYDLTKVPLRQLWKEIERRESILYQRRVRAEYRAMDKHRKTKEQK